MIEEIPKDVSLLRCTLRKSQQIFANEQMIEIASDLQDAYVEGSYWIDLECICEDLDD